MFSQESRPPCARGTTWSTVVARLPQYAHRCRSRISTPRLDHGACLRKGTLTYLHSLMTLGTGMSSAAPRIRSSGWACSTTALSCSTRTTARFNVTVDSGSKLVFRTSVSRIQPTSRAHRPPPGGLGINSGRARRDGQRSELSAPDHFQDQAGQTFSERESSPLYAGDAYSPIRWARASVWNRRLNPTTAGDTSASGPSFS